MVESLAIIIFFFLVALYYKGKINLQSLLLGVFLLLSWKFYLQEKFEEVRGNPNTQVITQLKERIRPMLTKSQFENLKIFDVSNKFAGTNVAQTVAKENIYICSRKKGSGELEDLDVLTYVLLHEMTHKYCAVCRHHDTNFLKEFEKTLDKAKKLGIRFKAKREICGVFVK